MKSVASFALGCKVNQVESEAIAEAFAEKGYRVVSIDECAEVYVINTCTVTNFGDKKSRQLIRRCKRQNPNALVVVAGCYAQTAPEEIKAIEGVNIVLGTKGKNEIVEEVEKYRAEMGIVNHVGEIMTEKIFEPISIHKLMGRTRAYIKIQDGCNQFCSYCIIPYARGPVRSRPEAEVENEVKILAQNGFKEVVLTGIHVASYGKELHNTSLLQVVEKIHDIEGIERIRFSSIEPNIVNEKFMEVLSRGDKVCHHFHLSLQSGCDRTLKAMNRKYSTEKYLQAVETIRKYWNDAAITTDIIVGFPGETDEDFNESYKFAQKVGFSKIHVFPYSPKRGTLAEKMDCQIDPQVKAERSRILIELSDKMAQDFINKYINKEVKVLFEQSHNEGSFEGHTSNYINVTVKSEENIKNKILRVKLTNAHGERAFGEIC
ncbi:MAG TPA: tRNA (N(6)-L-threonylcarbamoyladenosine(37)-C(2))-methylthiotransferase MtaB [Lachnospiraceae bacterium]|nr:tRNA (N(6)-L-threonylcarbamoyladenosine(37)-C(2))-methylthiotransferase MtaB [Lachnospiraceae bacterium]